MGSRCQHCNKRCLLPPLTQGRARTRHPQDDAQSLTRPASCCVALLLLQCSPQTNRGRTCCAHRRPGPSVRLGRCRHVLQRVCAPRQAAMGALAAPSAARQATGGAVPATAAACDSSRANSSQQAQEQGVCVCVTRLCLPLVGPSTFMSGTQFWCGPAVYALLLVPADPGDSTRAGRPVRPAGRQHRRQHTRRSGSISVPAAAGV